MPWETIREIEKNEGILRKGLVDFKNSAPFKALREDALAKKPYSEKHYDELTEEQREERDRYNEETGKKIKEDVVPIFSKVNDVIKKFEEDLKSKEVTLNDEQRNLLRHTIIGAFLQVVNEHPVETALTQLQLLYAGN
jgi:microsomal dipeptidase-like Zn-dependent dipeptidase